MTKKGNAPATVAAIDKGRRADTTSNTHYTTCIVARATFLLLTGLLLSPVPTARADSPAWEPETVYFPIVDGCDPENAPVPGPASGIDVPIDEGDVEILARLLWSSPLTNEDEKRQLCWLVFNRIDDERYGLFGTDVQSVVIRREFTWYDRKAYVSETNVRIAREELRRWNLYLIGAVKERLLPADMVYVAFNGRHAEFKNHIG